MAGLSPLQLMPGAAVPVAGVRMPLAQYLLRGRACTQAPQLLSSLYALCGQAHRICAQLALAALQSPTGLPVQADAPQRLALWRETLREHVRRMALDWPRLLRTGAKPDAHTLADLAACPALQPTLQWRDPALKAWLAQQVLGMPVEHWLQGCQKSPGEWLLQWAHEIRTASAQQLLAVLPRARAWRPALQPLGLDAGGAVLRQLAEAMRADEQFTSLPQWGGRCLETGCWSRWGETSLQVPDVWTRLAARTNDLAHLVQDAEGRWLRAGALVLDAGEAIAWCEMARGLLVHWLQVDAEGRIERYAVLAPTEWNFHPQGAAAQVLRELPASVAPQDIGPAVDLLVAAFDPCVEHMVVPARTQEGMACA
ncbi:MAG: nickel-dependent hydrogenase large subunit [Giesbergeria sp.]|jgi:hypothetical protein